MRFSANEVVVEGVQNKQVEKFSKTDQIRNSIENYFTDESETMIDLASETTKCFGNDNTQITDFKEILFIISSFLSLIFVALTIFLAILSFLNKYKILNRLYLTNLVLVIIIFLINWYIFIDSFQQVKIRFYLLLLSNIYLYNKVLDICNLNGNFKNIR